MQSSSLMQKRRVSSLIRRSGPNRSNKGAMTLFLLASVSALERGPALVLGASSSSAPSSSSRRRRRQRTAPRLMELPEWTLYDDPEDSSVCHYDSGTVTEEIFYPTGFGYLPILNEEYFDSIDEESTEYDMEAERVLSALERINEEHIAGHEEEEDESLDVSEEINQLLDRSEFARSSSTRHTRAAAKKRKEKRSRRNGKRTSSRPSRSLKDGDLLSPSEESLRSVLQQQEGEFQRQHQPSFTHQSQFGQTMESPAMSLDSPPSDNYAEAPGRFSSQAVTTQPPDHFYQPQPKPQEPETVPVVPSFSRPVHPSVKNTPGKSAARMLPRGGLSTTASDSTMHYNDATFTSNNYLSEPPNISRDRSAPTAPIMQQSIEITDASRVSTLSSHQRQREQQQHFHNQSLQHQQRQRLSPQQQTHQYMHQQQPQAVFPHPSSMSNMVNPVPLNREIVTQPMPAAPTQISKNSKKSLPKSQTLSSPSNNQSNPSSTTSPWVRKFLATRPKDVLLPVPKDFLSDGFNLAQLAPIVERIGLEAWAILGSTAEDQADSTGASEDSLQSQRLNRFKTQQRQDMENSLAAARSVTSSSHPIYRQALRLILQESLNLGSSGDENEQLRRHRSNGADGNIPAAVVQQAAEALYLMVHSRFVTSPRGLDTVRRILSATTLDPRNNRSKLKTMQQSHQAFLEPAFGRCPRIACNGMPLLPCGDSNDYSITDPDLPRKATISKKCKRYCACCREYYNFWDSKTDGCAWGPSFCHLFLMTHGAQVFPALVEQRESQQRMLQDQRQIAQRPTKDSTSTDKAPLYPQHSVMGFRIHPATVWGL